MGETDKFVLKWNDFEKNIVGAYKDLRTDADFFDCSLVCGGKTYQAHRVILSACSPVFREMIRETNHHHPVVYMRGVRPEDLLSVLDFMYHGQASVAEAELERFLEVAEDLQVRGLLLNGDGDKRGEDDSHRDGGDMDTALDDDVNDLLAGLDGQPPPSKRVKQERREATSTSQPGFSITTANGGPPSASVQDRIRVKKEAGLSSLPSGISMEKVAEPTPGAPASNTDYTPPPGITLTRPGQAPAHSQAPTLGSRVMDPRQVYLHHTNTPASSAPSPSPIVRSPLPQPRPGAPSPQTGPLPPYPSPAPARPGLSPGPGARPLVSPVRPGLPPPQVSQLRGPATVEHPVLHIPERFSSPAAGLAAPGAGPSAASPGMLSSLGARPPAVPGAALPSPGMMGTMNQQMLSPQQQLLVTQQRQHQHQLQQLHQLRNSEESDTTQTPQVDDLIEKAGSKLSCKECKKTYSNKSKAQLISHIESQHLKLEVKCDLCEKQFKATSYLKQHQKKGACAPTTN